MKMIIVVALALVAAASSLPVDEPTKIIRSEYNQDPEGSYRFGYETDDGSVRNEEGQLKEALDEDNKPHQVVVVRGSFTYINPDGKPETVNYFADETGFHAEGESIPKPARR